MHQQSGRSTVLQVFKTRAGHMEQRHARDVAGVHVQTRAQALEGAAASVVPAMTGIATSALPVHGIACTSHNRLQGAHASIILTMTLITTLTLTQTLTLRVEGSQSNRAAAFVRSPEQWGSCVTPWQQGRSVLALAGVIAEDGKVGGVAATGQARLHRVQLPVQARRCTTRPVFSNGL